MSYTTGDVFKEKDGTLVIIMSVSKIVDHDKLPLNILVKPFSQKEDSSRHWPYVMRRVDAERRPLATEEEIFQCLMES